MLFVSPINQAVVSAPWAGMDDGVRGDFPANDCLGGLLCAIEARSRYRPCRLVGGYRTQEYYPWRHITFAFLCGERRNMIRRFPPRRRREKIVHTSQRFVLWTDEDTGLPCSCCARINLQSTGHRHQGKTASKYVDICPQKAVNFFMYHLVLAMTWLKAYQLVKALNLFIICLRFCQVIRWIISGFIMRSRVIFFLFLWWKTG